MSWLQAFLLGVIEGITEYLPVSSTGHLLVAQRLLGISASADANAFAICIQAGAIVPVVTVFWRRVAQMLRGIAGRDPAGLRLALSIVVAFIPAAALGVGLGDLIEYYLFNPWSIVAAWIAGGAFILALDRLPRFQPHPNAPGLESLAWPAALVIGLAQCGALWPGVSRSLVTILAGVATGLSLPAAVEFSFLLGVVTLTAATGYETLRHGDAMVANFGWATLAVGFGAAWISALIAVRWLIRYVSHHSMDLFGYWRIGAGVVVAILLLAGAL